MKKYDITKYYNEASNDPEQKWISIHDIGSSFGGVKLTLEKYMKTEDAFVNAILLIFDYMKIDSCKIKNVYKCSLLDPDYPNNDVEVAADVRALYNKELMDTYENIQDDADIGLSDIANIIRLKLREDLGGEIYVPYRLKLFIGYDYMVGINTSKDISVLFPEIKNMGLHIFEGR